MATNDGWDIVPSGLNDRLRRLTETVAQNAVRTAPGCSPPVDLDLELEAALARLTISKKRVRQLEGDPHEIDVMLPAYVDPA